MSDDFGDRSDNSPAMRSFEEWLDQQAKQQNISREELFERLISSYWTLNEMVQLLDDSDNNTSLADLHTGDRSTDEGTGAVPTVGNSRQSDDPPRTRWSDHPNDRRRDPNDDRRREPQSEQHRDSQTDRRQEQSDRSASQDGTDPDRLADLRDRVDKLESELNAEKERGQSLDGLTEVLASRLTELETSIEELESESAATHESLSAADDDLAERLNDLEATLETRQDQLASEQKRIRSRLHSEFNDLETILEYLVTQTDELDAQITDVEGRYDEELSQLKWERDAVRSLKQAAAAHDAHAAECETCGERVDLDLLAEPYCQGCNSLLTGITEKDKWLFFSDIVVTTDGESEDTVSKPTRPTGDSESAAGSPSSQRTTTDTNPSPTPNRPESTDRQSSSAQRSGTAPTQRQSDDANSRRTGETERHDTLDSTIADRTSDTDSSDSDSAFNFGDFEPGTDVESSPEDDVESTTADDSDPVEWLETDE